VVTNVLRRALTRVFILSPLLASGCQRASVSPGVGLDAGGGAPSCSQIQTMALNALTATINSSEQCATKDDCGKLINDIGLDCLDCVFVAGGERLHAAIAAKAAEIKQLCQAFKSSGCKLMPSGCPGFAPDPRVECQQGHCVTPAMSDASADGARGIDSGSTALPACHWPATLTPTDAGRSRCTAKRHRLSCEGRDGGVFVDCISDRADQCDTYAALPGEALTCHDECAPDEYGVVCGGVGPGGPSSEPPAPSCRSAAQTPGGIAFYCCPCGP
jgi:hypothetical protein